jgi:DNA-binding beta-propeller fold protein YncE
MRNTTACVIGAIGWIVGTAACSPDRDADEDEATISGSLLARRGTPEQSYTLFETGQVRPLALSGDGRWLYATNTPDNRLEIFRVRRTGLEPVASVPVGLEPVAVAERCDGEVWVVNHLSDSVSIVNTRRPEAAYVAQTLLVGDEPRDIVFAGDHRSRAFITTAHRGQNTGRDPQLTTPGVGRADVWVFDARDLGHSLAGRPLTVVTLFADTPRALAVSPDGRTVYAAAFLSGNRTTTVTERIVTLTAGLPPPHTNAAGVPVPTAGLVVKYKVDPTDGNLHWLDNIGRRWDDFVRLSLPDKDVFTIDAVANPPVAVPSGIYRGVGTVPFNLAVNPTSGKIYVSNLDSRNDVRFEGHNVFGPTQGAPAGSVRGHTAESHITVIDPATGSVAARHLNKHIDFSQDGNPAEAARSLAFPTGMAISSDGRTLYVAALGSSKVGVFSTRALETDSFVPSTANQIALSGGGPGGLVLDAGDDRLYVLTRFDNSISILDTHRRTEIAHVAMFNPEPASVTNGRRFLYDAPLTSSHGDSACVSCHIFADFDGLAWDLGDPDDIVTPLPGPLAATPPPGAPDQTQHPIKGPMTTQSLRGLANHGPMHWRGDRTGGTDASRLVVLPSAQPDTGTFDEQVAFKKFNVAFDSLNGRTTLLDDGQMQALTDFMLQVTYPPNPIRNLDNSLTPDQQAGRDFFFSRTPDGQELVSDTVHNCNGCHVLDPTGNAQFGVAKPGFFGTDGRYSFRAEPQFLKVPHLRNLYQKVGMFGLYGTSSPEDSNPLLGTILGPPYNDNSFTGDQVRGFGFLHDGAIDTVFRFHSGTVFSRQPTNPGGFTVITDPNDPVAAAAEVKANITERRQVEAFMLAFDSNLAPVVGQQATLTGHSGPDVSARIDLLEARARAGECELVVKGVVHGRAVGFLYDPTTGAFAPDSRRARPLSDRRLRGLSRGGALTFTAVPPGSGYRIGLDRDLDGRLDGDDRR